MPTQRPIHWIYLGRNYLRMRQWESALGQGFWRVNYSNELQELAVKWRKPYLQWITKLGREKDSLEWWSSRIAERNTSLDSLFHSVCYLKIGIKFLLENNQQPLLVVAESRAVLRSVAEYPEVKGRVWQFNFWRTAAGEFIEYLRLVPIWLRYAVNGWLTLLDARRTRKSQRSALPMDEKPRVLIHTCIDETYFGADGRPHDRYFTVLPEELRRLGHGVLIIPWLYQIRRSRRKAFEWFRQHPGDYLIPEDFYSFSDYIWAAGVVLRQISLVRESQVFEDLDVTRLLQEACLKQASDTNIARFVRYVRLIQKWAKLGFKFNIFIDLFENMLTEKPQVIALRRWMPEVRTVGFQHSLAPEPLLLHRFTTPEEAAFAPHPDVIVCNSLLSTNLLIEGGFPTNKLRVGPSLRYLHLSDFSSRRVPEKNTLLVVLSLDSKAAMELFLKLRQAFSVDEGYRFWIKRHPMMSSREFEWLLQHQPLPGHMTCVEGPMNPWLERAACAIAVATNSALEIVLAGVPLVLVGRESDFDVNPLAWFPEFDKPVYSAEELRTQVIKKVSLSLAERKNLENRAEWMRRETLSPLTEETLSAFLRPHSGETVDSCVESSIH